MPASSQPCPPSRSSCSLGSTGRFRPRRQPNRAAPKGLPRVFADHGRADRTAAVRHGAGAGGARALRPVVPPGAPQSAGKLSQSRDLDAAAKGLGPLRHRGGGAALAGTYGQLSPYPRLESRFGSRSIGWASAGAGARVSFRPALSPIDPQDQTTTIATESGGASDDVLLRTSRCLTEKCRPVLVVVEDSRNSSNDGPCRVLIRLHARSGNEQSRALEPGSIRIANDDYVSPVVVEPNPRTLPDLHPPTP
jgi:hypothetical protein